MQAVTCRVTPDPLMSRPNAREVALGIPIRKEPSGTKLPTQKCIQEASRDAGNRGAYFLRLCPDPRGSPPARLFPGPSSACQYSKLARGPVYHSCRIPFLRKLSVSPPSMAPFFIPTKKPIYKWHRIRVLAENRLRPAGKLRPGLLPSSGPRARKRRRSPFSSVLVDGPQGCRMQFTESRNKNSECSQPFGSHHPQPNHNPRGRLQLKMEPLVRRDCGPRGDVCRSPT